MIGVDNFLTGTKKNLEAVFKSSFATNFKLIEADVNRSPEDYLNSSIKLDTIFHLASPASPVYYQKYPQETYLANSWATHQLLTFLHRYSPTTKFLFASTSEIYGDPLEHPQKESYWGNVNPNGLRSCYDEAKRLGETICGVFFRDYGLDTRIVRIFNTYGPRMDIDDGRVIPNLIKHVLSRQPLPIHGDGLQTRSYCYVTDLVRGLIMMIESEKTKGATVNLGNPEELSIMDTASLLLRLLHKPFDSHRDVQFLKLPADDPVRRRPDISKAKKILGWKPEVKFEDGLLLTLKYFQQEMMRRG